MTKSSFALTTALLLATSSLAAQQAAPALRPALPLQVEHPHYASVTAQVDVNERVDIVWERVGKYCDIGAWGIPGCTILSGNGDFGTVRSIGNEILVGKTQFGYTYTQPVRQGANYNMYHGTLEARALTPTTTRVIYTMMYDNSAMADDAAREKDLSNRHTRLNKWLENIKVLGEGGTLPPDALASPARPAAAR